MKITKRQLLQLVREAKGYTEKHGTNQADEVNEGTELSDMPDSWQQILGDCLVENAASARRKLLDSEYVQDSDPKVRYPYGRNRGDVRSNLVYRRKDGEPISDRDFAVMKAVEENNHPLGGMYTHTLSDDGMTLNVSYYKHTAG